MKSDAMNPIPFSLRHWRQRTEAVLDAPVVPRSLIALILLSVSMIIGTNFYVAAVISTRFNSKTSSTSRQCPATNWHRPEISALRRAPQSFSRSPPQA